MSDPLPIFSLCCGLKTGFIPCYQYFGNRKAYLQNHLLGHLHGLISPAAGAGHGGNRFFLLDLTNLPVVILFGLGGSDYSDSCLCHLPFRLLQFTLWGLPYEDGLKATVYAEQN